MQIQDNAMQILFRPMKSKEKWCDARQCDANPISSNEIKRKMVWCIRPVFGKGLFIQTYTKYEILRKKYY